MVKPTTIMSSTNEKPRALLPRRFIALPHSGGSPYQNGATLRPKFRSLKYLLCVTYAVHCDESVESRYERLPIAPCHSRHRLVPYPLQDIPFFGKNSVWRVARK